MKRMDAADVVEQFFALLDEVNGGEEVIITRDAKAVAVLSRARPGHRLLGLHEGLAWSNAIDEELFSTVPIEDWTFDTNNIGPPIRPDER
jgi:antitoxin (DNA-binding transcriptional repressor) of toxin-antitoxin stability system